MTTSTAMAGIRALVSNCLTGPARPKPAARPSARRTMTRAATRRALRCAPLPISHATPGPQGLSTRGAALFQPCRSPHFGQNPRAEGQALRRRAGSTGLCTGLHLMGTSHGRNSLRCRSTVKTPGFTKRITASCCRAEALPLPPSLKFGYVVFTSCRKRAVGTRCRWREGN